MILKTISVTKTTLQLLKPFEKELFLIASTYYLVSQNLSKILMNLKETEFDIDKHDQDFYS